MSCANTDWIVYGLVHPDTKLINYIGLSTRGLKRPQAHRTADRRNKHTHLGCWLQKLHRENIRFEIVVLEKLQEKFLPLLQSAEMWWIVFGRMHGWPLKNLTDGGEGTKGVKLGWRARKRIAARMRKRVWTDEMRANASRSAKEAHQRKLAEANLKAAQAKQKRAHKQQK